MSLTQTEWFIDKNVPIEGNGFSRDTPLKSFAKLSNIWGKGNLLSPSGANKTITVNILSDLDKTDPLIFNVILDRDVDLIFLGSKITSTQLAVSHIAPKNRDTNFPWYIITAQKIFTDQEKFFGKRICNETRGAIMWPVTPNLSGAPFHISEPLTMPTSPSYTFNKDNRVPLALNDDYSIQTLLSITSGSMRVGTVCASTSSEVDGKTIPKSRNKLVFMDLTIAGDISPELDMGLDFYCIGCSITGSIQLATGYARNFFNCCHSYKNFPGQTIRIISGLTRFLGGAYISAAAPTPPGCQGFLPTNCTTQFDLDVIFKEHSISIVAGNTLIIGTAGIFDSVPGGNGYSNSEGNGIMVSGGSVTCRKLQDTTHHLWGSDNGRTTNGAGVSVSSSGRFLWVDSPPDSFGNPTSVIPTITGAGIVDFKLGEKTSVSSYAPNNNGTLSGPFDNLWSLLKLPITPAPGYQPGFDGNAVNPKYDAWILKTQ